MKIHQTCSAMVSANIRCGKPGVQWWFNGVSIQCDCTAHLLTATFALKEFKTYQDALAYAAMESL